MFKLAGILIVRAVVALAQTQAGHSQAGPIKLWAGISVPQPIFDQAELERLQLFFAVYNEGSSTANPNVESSHLLINGVEPPDWQIVIGNGIRGEWFYKLPPGQTLQFGYQLGPRYFTRPGIYTVRWKGEGFESPVLTFRVVRH